MRIVSFRRAGQVRFGVRQADGIREAADPSITSPLQLIGQEVELAGEVCALADLDLLPVIPHPGKIVCLGLNYVEHAKEGGNPIPSYPALFLRATTSLTAHGKPILRPACSEQLDYEAELAVIIGVGGKDIAESAALTHVAGYACFNDGSIRDYQRKSTQWTAGKNFDATGGFGPELVTPDELPAGAHGLRISSRLNGKVMQDGNTADMIFSVARTIAIVSEAMTLEPGDVIITGTPSGVGYARKPPVFMRAGDVCEVEIEGVGTLQNPIADA
jgi:2-keto-4-pentenoate hydratase/2-oxohepta-3-ene-1,7-dioic acid hydratase in catechol pathway